MTSTRILLTLFLLVVLACTCYSVDSVDPNANPTRNEGSQGNQGGSPGSDRGGSPSSQGSGQDDNNDHRSSHHCSLQNPNSNSDCKPVMEVVIDTDMGLDDITSIAILLAHSVEHQYIRSNSQQVKILGISTVDGIAHVQNGTSNILRILQRLGRSDIKVYQGEVLVNGSQGHIIKPFADKFRPFHSQLPGIIMPPQANFPEKESVPEFFIRITREHPGLTLYALGPLSNVAMAMQMDPTFPSRVGKLVMMAGAVYVPGNARPNPNVSYIAEWNLYVDQWATAMVFNSGQFSGKAYLAPLDIAYKWFYANASVALNTPGLQLTEVGAFMQNAVNVGIGNANIYLYDPCAAELLLRPDLQTLQLVPISSIPSGYNASALYVADPRTSTGFTWLRAALDLDQVATMDWYRCTATGTCTR